MNRGAIEEKQKMEKNYMKKLNYLKSNNFMLLKCGNSIDCLANSAKMLINTHQAYLDKLCTNSEELGDFSMETIRHKVGEHTDAILKLADSIIGDFEMLKKECRAKMEAEVELMKYDYLQYNLANLHLNIADFQTYRLVKQELLTREYELRVEENYRDAHIAIKMLLLKSYSIKAGKKDVANKRMVKFYLDTVSTGLRVMLGLAIFYHEHVNRPTKAVSVLNRCVQELNGDLKHILSKWQDFGKFEAAKDIVKTYYIVCMKMLHW